MFWTFSSDAFACPTALLGTPGLVTLNCLYQGLVDGSDLFSINRSVHCSFSGGFMVNELISHSDTHTHIHTHVEETQCQTKIIWTIGLSVTLQGFSG